MKKIFLLLALVMFVGCGGGGGDDAVVDDLVADDEGNTDVADTQTAAAPLKAFVTSTSNVGKFSVWAEAGGAAGLAAADAVCNARAKAAGIEGTFVSWLSDDTSDAYCRLHGLIGKKDANCGQAELPASAGPWVRMDGTPLADKIDKMITNGSLNAPVRFNEFGKNINSYEDPAMEQYLSPNGVQVFTNTDTDGKGMRKSPCNNWTDDNWTEYVFGGLTGRTGPLWTGKWNDYHSSIQCKKAAHLLCMQLGTGPELPVSAQTGKIAFVSSASGSGKFDTWPEAGGKTGIEAADAICSNLATTAGLSGTFKAYISDSTHYKYNRLSSGVSWVRLDGVQVANSKEDMLQNISLAPLNVTEKKEYVTESAWIGQNDENYSCKDWSSEDPYGRSVTGATDSDVFYSTEDDDTCDKKNHIYCFED